MTPKLTPDSTETDLGMQLAHVLYSVPADDRQRAHWVLNTGWRDRLTEYARATGIAEPAVWTELLGLPFVIDDSYHGFPTLHYPSWSP